MKLFTDDRSPERTRSFEGAGEGEVVGLDRLTAHVRKVEEGGGEMTVLDRASNEGGPGDDGAVVGGGELEDELG